MNDLDWLAENVNEWNTGYTRIGILRYANNDPQEVWINPEYAGGITQGAVEIKLYKEAEWHNRRVELGLEQVTLQPGDYVDVRDTTAEKRKDIADAFISAGAKAPLAYPFEIMRLDDKYIGWVYCDDVWILSSPRARLLTIDQVLNATNAKKDDGRVHHALDGTEGIPCDESGRPVWRGPEDGLPPAGSTVVLADASEYFKPKHGREGEEVVILCHTIAPNGSGVAVYCSENVNGNPANGIGVAKCFMPARTPEEKAVEEMINDIGFEQPTAIEVCELLYRAGYRKQE